MTIGTYTTTKTTTTMHFAILREPKLLCSPNIKKNHIIVISQQEKRSLRNGSVILNN